MCVFYVLNRQPTSNWITSEVFLALATDQSMINWSKLSITNSLTLLMKKERKVTTREVNNNTQAAESDKDVNRTFRRTSSHTKLVWLKIASENWFMCRRLVVCRNFLEIFRNFNSWAWFIFYWNPCETIWKLKQDFIEFFFNTFINIIIIIIIIQ